MIRKNVMFGLLAAAGLAASANATVHTLADGNSLVGVDDSSQAGMFAWQADGMNHLYQQWFWFRVNGVDSQEHSIDTLPLNGAALFDTNLFTDPRPDTLALSYGDANLSIEPTFTLRSSAVGTNSSIQEAIRIVNHTNTVMSLSFFQYCDFDVGGTSGGDTAQIIAGNTARQWDSVFGTTESVVTPAPTHYQVDTYPNILNLLNNGATDNLNDFAGAMSGDMTWAFQWDFTIAPGGSVTISKLKSVTPAPGSIALIGLGGLLVSRRRR